MLKMVDYINRKALELTMASGMRFIEAKRFVMDIAGEARCIGSHNRIDELDGIVEENVQFDQDYLEYKRRNSA